MKENGDQGNFIYPYSATDTGVVLVYYSFYVVAVSKREMGGHTPSLVDTVEDREMACAYQR